MSKTNIPQIRFRTFNKKYQTEIAKDIFTAISDKNHADLPVLSASQSQGMIVRDDIGISMTYSRENVASYKRVCPGQFVIHLRSFQGGLAHSSIEGITSPAYTILAFKNNQSQYDYYWKYIFSSDAFIKRLELVTYGIRDGRNISYEEFQKLSFIFPHPDEQVRVASLFQCLDDLIQSRQEAFAKLKVLKQSCLEKMFPREGAKVPEIRFKGFDGDWVYKSLSTVARPYYVSNKDIHHQNLLSLSYGKIINKDIKEKRGLLPASFDTYQVIKEGIIVFRFTDLQNDHKSLRVGLATQEGIITSAYVCIECKDDVIPGYLYLLLHYYDTQKKFYKMGDGLRQTLSYQDIKDMHVSHPSSKKEQQAIVDYFTSLDQLITAREKELEKLRQIKKACLERMFVTD